jgi:hypothetical protein
MAVAAGKGASSGANAAVAVGYGPYSIVNSAYSAGQPFDRSGRFYLTEWHQISDGSTRMIISLIEAGQNPRTVAMSHVAGINRDLLREVGG